MAIFLGSLGGIVGIIAVVYPEMLLDLAAPFMDKYARFSFAVIGAVLLVLDFFWIYKTKNFLDRCLKTKGVVIDLSWRSHEVPSEVSHGEVPDTSYEVIKFAHPVVQFVEQRSGRKIKVESSVGSARPAYHVGEEVAVLYDPENPSNARIKSFWEIWGTVVSLTVLGGMFLSLGLIVAYIIL